MLDVWSLDHHVTLLTYTLWKKIIRNGDSHVTMVFRHEAWNMLRQLAQVDSLPWCIFGDFNDLLYAKDSKHPHPQNLLDGFRLAIDDCRLTELEVVDGDFTWKKSKGSTNWVREKLDRAFASSGWSQKFPLCKLSVTHTISSDHDPILLDLYDTTVSRK